MKHWWRGVSRSLRVVRTVVLIALLICVLLFAFVVIGSQVYAATHNNVLAVGVGIGCTVVVALGGRWWAARPTHQAAARKRAGISSPRLDTRRTFSALAAPPPVPPRTHPGFGYTRPPTQWTSAPTPPAVTRLPAVTPANTPALQGVDSRRGQALIVDRAASAARAAQLETYLAGQVLTPRGEFICSSARSCKSSAQRAGVSFLEAQGHSVGSCYDLATAEGVPIRVLIVPMESGGNADYQHITVAQRSRDIEVRAAQTFGERNPHMKGVTLALRLAFGLPVDDADAESLQFTDGTTARMLSCYAMANLLLCSAVDTGTMKSRQTGVMRANCVRHLLATVKILQPTLVISQGAKLESTLRASLSVTPELTPNLAECNLRGNRFVWVQLHHPTRNWSALTHPYLHEVVVPTISRARLRALAIAGTPTNTRSGPKLD